MLLRLLQLLRLLLRFLRLKDRVLALLFGAASISRGLTRLNILAVANIFDCHRRLLSGGRPIAVAVPYFTPFPANESSHGKA